MYRKETASVFPFNPTLRKADKQSKALFSLAKYTTTISRGPSRDVRTNCTRSLSYGLRKALISVSVAWRTFRMNRAGFKTDLASTVDPVPPIFYGIEDVKKHIVLTVWRNYARSSNKCLRKPTDCKEDNKDAILLSASPDDSLINIVLGRLGPATTFKACNLGSARSAEVIASSAAAVGAKGGMLYAFTI